MCTFFCRSDSGIVGANPSREMDVFPFLYLGYPMLAEALRRTDPPYQKPGKRKALACSALQGLLNVRA